MGKLRSLSVAEGITILKSGGVIAYPTETFYGLGASTRNEKAVERIFTIKGRSFKNPISILVADESELKKWVFGLDGRAKYLIKYYWPGPLTLLFKARSSVLKCLTAGTDLIGVRISSNKTAQKFAEALGAITTTSANQSGQAPAKTPRSVVRKLGKRIDGVASTQVLTKRKASTILDISCSKIKLIREGLIPFKEIEELLNEGLSKNFTL